MKNNKLDMDDTIVKMVPKNDLLENVMINYEEFLKILQQLDNYLSSPKNVTSFKLLPFDKK